MKVLKFFYQEEYAHNNTANSFISVHSTDRLHTSSLFCLKMTDYQCVDVPVQRVPVL